MLSVKRVSVLIHELRGAVKIKDIPKLQNARNRIFLMYIIFVWKIRTSQGSESLVRLSFFVWKIRTSQGSESLDRLSFFINGYLR